MNTHLDWAAEGGLVTMLVGWRTMQDRRSDSGLFLPLGNAAHLGLGP